MKIAVINFSGNVGKSTVAHHLLAPRLEGANVIAIESINADGSEIAALRGTEFDELQEKMMSLTNVVVDAFRVPSGSYFSGLEYSCAIERIPCCSSLARAAGVDVYRAHACRSRCA